MRDVAQLRELVETATGKLDTLSKMLAKAHDELTFAEEAWDEAFDAVAESLTEEYRDAGRKSDPAEHTIKAAARRSNREAYTRWRRAKREVEKLEKVSTNRCNELSGYQSELGVEKALLPLDSGSGPQPAWSERAA